MVGLIALLLPSGTNPAITLVGPTKPLPQILDEIAAQAEVEITIEGPAARDVVYLHVSNRALPKTLDLIASATRSKWTETSPGKFKIHPDPTASKVDPEFVDAIRAALAESPVASVLDRPAAESLVQEAIDFSARPRSPQWMRDAQKFDARMPAAQAFNALLHSFGAEALAALPEEVPQVFLFNPVGRARPLPAAARSRILGLSQEHRLLSDALGRKGQEPPAGEDARLPLAIWRLASPDAGASASDWKVSLTRRGAAISGSIQRVDSEGFYREPLAVFYLSGKSVAARPNPFIELKETFTWPESSFVLLNAFADSRRDPSVPPQAVVQRLINCGREETLASGNEPALEALARHSGRDVIAVLPDDTVAYVAALGAETAPLGTALRNTTVDPVVTEAENALIIQSATWRNIRKARLPRSEAAALFREFNTRGYVTLDTLASLRARADSNLAVASALNFIAMMRFQPEPLLEESDLPVLALYSSLEPGQRKNFVGPCSSLPPEAYANLFTLMLKSPPITAERPRLQADPEIMLEAAAFSRLQLKMSVKEKPLVCVARRDDPIVAEMVTAPPYLKKTTDAWKEERLFAPASETSLEVVVEMPGSKPLNWRMALKQVPHPLEWTTFQKLPESIREAVGSN